MSPRLRGSVAAATLLVAVLLVPAAAGARDATVASFDGTQLNTHFFPATNLAAGAKAPTVMVGPGWSQAGDSNDESADDPTVGATGLKTLRDAGYNVLTWDPRGFGSSGGTVEVDSQMFEGKDVESLIDFIAKQPEAQLDAPGDPRVGMSGASYGGGIQLVSAAIDKRIDAIVPVISWHSLQTALYKDNTVKTGWSSILYSLGQALGHLDPHIGDAYTQGLATGSLPQDDLDYFVSRGPGDLVNQIRIPTLFIQGTVDDLFTLQEAVTNYGILRRNGVPTKMLWFCGGHGACITNPGDQAVIAKDTIAWLNRYLKGDASVDTGPRFQWVDQDGKERTASDYPLAAGTPLTADGSGTLPLVAGGGSGPVVSTSGSGVIATLAAPVAPAKAVNAVNVTIPAPAADTPVVGAPLLQLTYSGTSEPSDARVFAQVVDDATGDVLGNQITPIPLVLDGAEHSVSRYLELLSATAHPGSTFTLQLVASSTAYNLPHYAGSVSFSKIHVELPVPDLSKTPPDAGAVGASTVTAQCASRRTLTVHLLSRFRAKARSVKVLVAGKKIASGKVRAKGWKITLAGRPKGTTTVALVMTLRDGRTVTDTRSYRLCTKRGT